jgi:magnesium transporter
VAIAAVGTLVAGVYGMNFVDIPELRWHFGYYYALGLMVTASVVLYRFFKKSGWL